MSGTGQNYYARAGRAEENQILNVYAGTTEKTYEEGPEYSDSFLKPFNPDDLYQKTGDYETYEDMLKDDQVSIAMQIKKDLVLGSGFDIVCDDPEQGTDIVDDIYLALTDDQEVGFIDQLEDILTAYEFGFSLTEKIFKKRPDGSLTLGRLKTRHPSTWRIFTDDRGNIERYNQITVAGDLDIDPNSLIHYVNKRRFQNPYGESDLRPAHAAWFAKNQVIRYFAIYLEKAASPTPIGKADANAPESAKTRIFNVLKKLQSRTALVIPKEFEVEFLEAKTNGEAYHKAIDIFNMFIGRALFIPDLLGFQGGDTKGGSYSLGKDQLGVLFKHIGRRRKTLEKIIDAHIIRPITYYNWGAVDFFPKFKFEPIEEKDVMIAVDKWIEAVKSKTYKPSEEEINHFRELVNFPQGDVEFPEAPAPIMPSSPQNPPVDIDTDDNEDEKEEKQFAKVYKPLPGDYDKKVDYAAIESQLNSGIKTTMSQLAPVVDYIYGSLIDQIEKKKIVQNDKLDRIESIKLPKLKELKTILKTSLRDNYNKHQILAKNEILNPQANFAKTMPAEEFLEILEKETFEYIGDWEYDVTKRARVEMTNAVKEGRPLSAVIDVLEADGKNASLVSLERYARTKFTETMNRGRLEFFEQSKVVNGYQYSAILDDRTSLVCRGLHGKKFKAGTQPTPPLHFGCRSLLVPITIYEEFRPSEKVGKRDINEFIVSEKGKGF